MKNARGESVFASGALVLLLSLTLFYGCRAFDPEPVILNRPPDTFIIGAPAETTGTGFRRHLYWYGTDLDGEVVQFIYAVMDTTVRDIDDPTTDEENRRFNPAEDITTVTENEGFVGWTTKTDSVFIFTVDREEKVQKEVTFHIVAVDDRGGIDPTPARLRFLNNAFDTPSLRFRVYTGVDPESGEGGDLRWVGTPGGPDADSPEQTDNPFVGFQVPFRVTWNASTPNVAPEFEDPIRGYRYKAGQGPSAPFVPGADSLGTKLFSDVDSFFYSNSIDGVVQQQQGLDCDPNGAVGCDVSTLRFASGRYVLSVEAVDQALVQSRQEDGQLRFEINYPPTTLLTDEPTFVVRNPLDPDDLLRGPEVFSEGDTIPHLAEVTFTSQGYDRFESSLIEQGLPTDTFCCDVRRFPNRQEVTFIETVRARLREEVGGSSSLKTSRLGDPNASGTVSFRVAPFDYTYVASTVDELGRRALSPTEFDFFVGRPPVMQPAQSVPNETTGTGNRRVIVAIPPGGFQPVLFEGSSFATLQPWEARINDREFLGCSKQIEYDPSDPDIDGETVRGYLLTVNPVLVGAPAPPRADSDLGPGEELEPLGDVRAFSYSLNSIYDPDNLFINGAAESVDLSAFLDTPEGSENQLDFAQLTPERQLTFWLPEGIFFGKTAMARYDPNPDSDGTATEKAIGCNLVRQLGPNVMRFRGRVTRDDDRIDFFEYRTADGTRILDRNEPIGRFGKKSQPAEIGFELYLGVDGPFPPGGDGVIDPDNLDPDDRIWPDELATSGLDDD